ncbi:MAG: FUSC family protein [Xanthobacteraceae bacterium]|nr:FUSC family protein [Xanthobacteraceae bacterium]
MNPTLSSLGFEAAKLPFAFRTAVAACLALVWAWSIGLEHPQWSAMTVWAASQPLRGHLLEKSAARLAGTVIGALFGIALMVISHGQPTVVVIGISLWIGICAFIGNLVRGYASYAAILSGYSAAMVALLDSAHPEHVLALGADRMLTVTLGVVAALLMGWLFAAPGDDTTLVEKARMLTDRIVANIIARRRGAPISEDEQQSFLSGIAALEGTLDLHNAGSRARRRLVRKIRVLLALQVTAVLGWRSDPSQAAGASDLEADLAAATSSLDESSPGGEFALHRDWLLAWRATLRAVVAMLVVGAIWLATHWQLGGFMMLGTSIMVSIFSTFENPAVVLRYVFVGQLLGVTFALVCRWLVWPMAHGPFELILAMVPFILFGAPVFAHRLTQRMAFDYNMVMLLLLQPAWPQTMSFEQSLMAGVAVIAGPLVGLIAFGLIYPVDSRRRYEAVRFSMIDDLERLAASAITATHRKQWRALLHHRILLATYWGERASYSPGRLADDALALLSVGQAIEQLGDLATGAPPRRIERRIITTLERLRRVSTDPARAAQSLLAAARQLAAVQGACGPCLAQAADKLAERPAAFRKAVGRPH